MEDERGVLQRQRGWWRLREHDCDADDFPKRGANGRTIHVAIFDHGRRRWLRVSDAVYLRGLSSDRADASGPCPQWHVMDYDTDRTLPRYKPLNWCHAKSV